MMIIIMTPADGPAAGAMARQPAGQDSDLARGPAAQPGPGPRAAAASHSRATGGGLLGLPGPPSPAAAPSDMPVTVP